MPSTYKLIITMGKCRDMDSVIFDADSNEERPPSAAALVCARCPVQKECLDFALENEYPGGESGIWGGTAPGQRRKLKSNTPRVKCPGCLAHDTIIPNGHGQLCVSCGISWNI